MNTTICPACKMEIHIDATRCPHCTSGLSRPVELILLPMLLSRWITVVSTVAAILSMFFNWVDHLERLREYRTLAEMAAAERLEQLAYLLLAFWIYPIFGIIKNKDLNFIGGLACSLGSTISVLAYLNFATIGIEETGEIFKVGSTGAYIFLLASLGFTFAVFKYRK